MPADAPDLSLAESCALYATEETSVLATNANGSRSGTGASQLMSAGAITVPKPQSRNVLTAQLNRVRATAAEPMQVRVAGHPGVVMWQSLC